MTLQNRSYLEHLMPTNILAFSHSNLMKQSNPIDGI